MDYYKFREKRNVTPEKMVKILGKHGTIIRAECAEKILELIYRLSNLSVRETLDRLPEQTEKRRFTRHTRKPKGDENS